MKKYKERLYQKLDKIGKQMSQHNISAQEWVMFVLRRNRICDELAVLEKIK